MVDWFVWKETKCTDYGIRAVSLPDIAIPEERVNFVSIPGRSGSIKVKESYEQYRTVYNDLSFSVTCVVDDVKRIYDIENYLTGESNLIFGNRPEVYYKASIVNQIPFQKIVRGDDHRTITVNFRCEPIPYYVFEELFIKLDVGTTTVFNPHNTYSEPTIIITIPEDNATNPNKGSINFKGKYSDCTIEIDTTGVPDGCDTINLECETGECFYVDDNTYPAGRFVVGDVLPVLESGGTKVTVTGNLRGIYMHPNWRVKT